MARKVVGCDYKMKGHASLALYQVNTEVKVKVKKTEVIKMNKTIEYLNVSQIT